MQFFTNLLMEPAKLIVFVIFAKILFSAGPSAVPVMAADIDSEHDAVAAMGPGYDVPLQARDPFLPPDTPPRVAADAGNEPAQGIGISQLQLEQAVRITMVSSAAAGNFAILNNQLVSTGDVIRIRVAGKEIAMAIVRISPSAHGVTLRYEDKEFFIRSRLE